VEFLQDTDYANSDPEFLNIVITGDGSSKKCTWLSIASEAMLYQALKLFGVGVTLEVRLECFVGVWMALEVSTDC
jgi:hypothetical protein